MPPVAIDNNFLVADPAVLTGLSVDLLPLGLGSFAVATAAVLVIRRSKARKASSSTIPSSPQIPYSDEETTEAHVPLMYHQRLHYKFPGRHCIIDSNMVGTDDGTGPAGDTSSRSLESCPPCSVESISDNGDTRQEHDPPAVGSHSAGQRSEVIRPRFIMSRPPPPPPLTPPERSSSIFTIEDVNRSRAGTAPELDTSFFEQPNPDFMESSDVPSEDQSAATTQTQNTPIPRRLSYTRMLPINTSPASSPATAQGGSRSLTTPSSFPPSSPSLPGPLPAEGGSSGATSQEIEVQGEIISVMDDSGAGWKRHTRIYGGGVCLACAAAANDGQGGFYGANVRPEDRR
ncbi:hypothetical protein ACRALDRAFT_2040503 [Sodiomyces alcalophilus JCM 7366]|uniref:uncharacterized protein n=1 Tax=Sodiomyces alcalophilus JCM 7366 TaxID=591952 RepID=UPI0039B44127